jgi:tRNA pseudouridine55 synthase
VGPFTLKDAILLDNLEQLRHSHRQSEVLMPINTVLDDIPVVELVDEDVRRIRQGQVVETLLNDTQLVFCITEGQVPVALGEISQGILKSRRVFNL